MTNPYNSYPADAGQPAWEWPIGGLLRVRQRALLDSENTALRGALVVVRDQVRMKQCSPGYRVRWAWVKEVYCLKRQRHHLVRTRDLEVVDKEPAEQVPVEDRRVGPSDPRGHRTRFTPMSLVHANSYMHRTTRRPVEARRSGRTRPNARRWCLPIA